MPHRRPVVVNNPGGGLIESASTREAVQIRQESSGVERPVVRPGSIAEPQQTRSSGQTRPATNTTSPSRSGGSAPSVQQPQRQPSSTGSSPQRVSTGTRRPPSL
jgi:hypothetical protein